METRGDEEGEPCAAHEAINATMTSGRGSFVSWEYTYTAQHTFFVYLYTP
jgi:hypothetical protein